MILFGPGSLSSERRPTPQTNAVKWGVTAVTDGAIAFSAIMVHISYNEFDESAEVTVGEISSIFRQGVCGDWRAN